MADDDQSDALSTFETGFEDDGVAVSSVDDGHVFMFSVDTLLTLLQKATDAKSDRVVVFVMNPETDKKEVN